MKLKKLRHAVFVVAAFALCVSLSVQAQTPVVVQRADLSIPFGTVSGKLVVVADQLVFVDNDRQEDSFVIARSEILELKADNDVVMISTRRPVRARGEEKSQFNFRLREGSSESLTLWAGVKSAPTSTAMSAATPAGSGNEQDERWVYNAKHPHKVALVPSGSCTGKLIITRDRVVYESLEDREHTRQWPLADIKNVKRKSPYQIEIEPFNRETYTLEIEGKGIDVSVHKQLMNRISIARQK
ncbi:MAG: hypothetical protein KA368_00190 [Acidobacteria bacterium]|nr:hypothetical protein [Acidobacteriota bacterium]